MNKPIGIQSGISKHADVVTSAWEAIAEQERLHSAQRECESQIKSLEHQLKGLRFMLETALSARKRNIHKASSDVCNRLNIRTYERHLVVRLAGTGGARDNHEAIGMWIGGRLERAVEQGEMMTLYLLMRDLLCVLSQLFPESCDGDLTDAFHGIRGD